MGDFKRVIRRTSVAAVLLAGLAASPAGAQAADTERPSVPSSRIVLSGLDDTSVNATWGASTDDVAVVGYNVYVDGSLRQTSPDITVDVDQLQAGTEYEIYVRAIDAAGNEGWRSGIVRFTTTSPPDTERPSVVSRGIRLEPNGRFISWGPAVDNRSVVKYVLFDADTRTVFAETSDIRFELPRDAADYRLFVKAEDAAGNQSFRSGIAEISIAGDPDRPSIPGAIQWTRPAAGTISMTWTASTDNIGVAGYRVFTADRTLITETATNSATFSFAGAGSFYVRAFDAAGNESYRTGLRNIPAG